MEFGVNKQNGDHHVVDIVRMEELNARVSVIQIKIYIINQAELSAI